MNTSILFIGNFLSRTRGSYAVSEFIADRIAEEWGIRVIKASHAENRMVRLMEILWAVFFKNFTLVHIDVFSGNSFLFARLAAAVGKLRQKKVVLTLHGGALHEHYIGREAAFRSLFKKAYVQSPSHFLRDFFEHEHFTVNYCPNPVSLTNFPYARTLVKPDSLLWVRAFTKIYNPHIPVEVLKNILQDFPHATLTMIGPDKGLMQQTIERIGELKLSDKVNIVGPVSNAQLFTYYQSHAVYLNSTSYESFGVSLVEAASCGVPIVSFSVGEIPYLWQDGENILLCEPSDSEKMTDLVKQTLRDPEWRIRLSVNARRRAEDFSWDNIKSHWYHVLDLDQN